jgi:hypothetical protein
VGTAVKLTLTHEIDRPESKLIRRAVSGELAPGVLSNLKSLLETGKSRSTEARHHVLHVGDVSRGTERSDKVRSGNRRPAPHAREPSKVSRGPLDGAAAHWARSVGAPGANRVKRPMHGAEAGRIPQGSPRIPRDRAPRANTSPHRLASLTCSELP